MRSTLQTDFFKPPMPRAFGHRGSAGTHPENTLLSFQAAVDAGACYLELDVHMTRDGEVVVSHDDNLERTSGRPGLIREMDYVQVREADAGFCFAAERGFPFRGRGIKIPRLADVLATFHAFRFIIEVKQEQPSLVQPMLHVIDSAGMAGRVLIASERQKPLDEVRRSTPGIPTNFSYEEGAGFLNAMANPGAPYQPPGDALQIPTTYHDWKLATPETVAAAHRLGIEVHIWTVNEEPEMRALLDMGVDGIISDYPQRLLRVIAERA